MSVAVCITGQLRAATCRLGGAGAHSPTAIETIGAFLRRELRGSDVFVVLDSPPAADAAATALHAAAVQRVASAVRPVEIGFDDAAAAHAAYSEVRASGACLTLSAVAQARKLESCLRMIEAAEQRRGRALRGGGGGGGAGRYTHLLRLRPDTMMPSHLNLSRYGLTLRGDSGDTRTPASTAPSRAAARAARSSYLGPADGSEGLLTPDTCLASKRGQQACHARCTRVLHKAERARLERQPPQLLTVPPYTGKVHDETFLNDIFFLATRELATPMLSHLQAGLRWARQEQASKGRPAKAAPNKASACAGARLPLAPRCSPSGTGAAAGAGLCTTGGHECLLTLGLLTHHHDHHQASSRPQHGGGGSQPDPPLRVRYLSQADWPKLLRLAETDAGCAPYRQAYECTEKAKIHLRLANLTGRAAAAAVMSRCSKALRERQTDQTAPTPGT